MKRRDFILRNGLALGGLALSPPASLAARWFFPGSEFISQRPSAAKRTFTSAEVERTIGEVKAAIADPELGWMFENCYPNTLDTTVDFEMIDGKPDTFIITGDIDAMWLRDSTAQVWPYMPLINADKNLRLLVLGLVHRQVKCVLTDPYANAFYKDLTKESEWQSDQPTPQPGVHERKWEVDSLCYVIRLSNEYYRITGDASAFSPDWDRAMRLIVQTFKTEQRKDGHSPYRFVRRTANMIDAPVFSGTGRPIRPTGMICSMFRPSDDATLYPFLVPSNVFAVQSLRQLALIYKNVLGDTAFSAECAALAEEVESAIEAYAVTSHAGFGRIYAYEVDGFGNRIFMDDANVPSLMSLAYLGAHQPDDPVYSNTRAFLLSDFNPWFLRGTAAEGQGSPHTGKEMIWPMGIILRAMTSVDQKEIGYCLQMLRDTHAGTGFMHEAFHKDDPANFTRSWFAWANTLFGELIIKIYQERPELLQMRFR